MVEQTPPTSDQVPSSPLKKRLLLPLTAASISLVIFSALATVGVTATGLVYKASFLKPEYKVALMKLASKIPLAPQTNSQIILSALETAPQIRSYQNQSSFLAKLSSRNLSTTRPLARFFLNTQSSLNFSQPNNPQGESQTLISFTMTDSLEPNSTTNINAELETRFLENTLYINLKNLEGLDSLWSYANLKREDVLNQWYSLNLGEQLSKLKEMGLEKGFSLP